MPTIARGDLLSRFTYVPKGRSPVVGSATTAATAPDQPVPQAAAAGSAASVAPPDTPVSDLLDRIMRGELPTAGDMALLPYVLMLPLNDEQDARVKAIMPGMRAEATQAELDGLQEALEGRRWSAPAASDLRNGRGTPSPGDASRSGERDGIPASAGAQAHAAAAAASRPAQARSPEVAKVLAAFDKLVADATTEAAVAGTASVAVQATAAPPSLTLPLRSHCDAVALLYRSLVLAAAGRGSLVSSAHCEAFLELAQHMGPIVEALGTHGSVDKRSAELLAAAVPKIRRVLPFFAQVKNHTGALDIRFISEALVSAPETFGAGTPIDPATTARLAYQLTRGYDHFPPEHWMRNIERHRKLIRHAQMWRLISPAQREALAVQLDLLAGYSTKPDAAFAAMSFPLPRRPLRLDETNVPAIARGLRDIHRMSDDRLAELRADIRGYHLSTPGALGADAFDSKYAGVLQGRISDSGRRLAFAHLAAEISKLLAT